MAIDLKPTNWRRLDLGNFLSIWIQWKDSNLKWTCVITLRELIFAGAILSSRKIFQMRQTKRSNNSQKGFNFLSSEKSAKLTSRKKSQNCEPEKLVPAKISSLKIVFLAFWFWARRARWRVYLFEAWKNETSNLTTLFLLLLLLYIFVSCLCKGW